jgi:iron complex outermembrane recepter protein
MANFPPRGLDTASSSRCAAAAAVAVALGVSGIANADDAAPLQEVTVTGSRIALSPGMLTPTPVTAVTQDELIKMAPTNVIDALNALPQFFGNSTYQQALGGQSPSGSEINLRGANTSSGISRTLVLLDGRRSVANSRFGAVDIGSFPDTLIKSVEVVTGGASASYGTDAVAGVVNFILDTKFEGVKAEAQGRITARRDGPNSKFSLTFGHQFGEKFHIIGSIANFDQDAISDFSSLQDRPWFNQASRVSGPPGGDLCRFTLRGPDELQLQRHDQRCAGNQRLPVQYRWQVLPAAPDRGAGRHRRLVQLPLDRQRNLQRELDG